MLPRKFMHQKRLLVQPPFYPFKGPFIWYKCKALNLLLRHVSYVVFFPNSFFSSFNLGVLLCEYKFCLARTPCWRFLPISGMPISQSWLHFKRWSLVMQELESNANCNSTTNLVLNCNKFQIEFFYDSTNFKCKLLLYYPYNHRWQIFAFFGRDLTSN